MNIEDEMRETLERHRIGALQTTFSQALDGGTCDQFLSVFTADVDYSNGPRKLSGHDELRAFFEARRAAGRVSRHIMSGMDITFDGPDRASGKSVWVSFAGDGPMPVQNTDPFLVADMHDTYVRTAEGWRIARRAIVPVFRNPRIGAPPTGKLS